MIIALNGTNNSTFISKHSDALIVWLSFLDNLNPVGAKTKNENFFYFRPSTHRSSSRESSRDRFKAIHMFYVFRSSVLEGTRIE